MFNLADACQHADGLDWPTAFAVAVVFLSGAAIVIFSIKRW